MTVKRATILFILNLCSPIHGNAQVSNMENIKAEIHEDDHAKSVSESHELERLATADRKDIEHYMIFIGKIEANPNKVSHLNPRYPGVVRSVQVDVGDSVKRGQILASVDSNVGVQTFSLKANISGTIVHRKLAVGEFVDENRLAFSIADLSDFWVQLSVRQRELKHFTKGQEVKVVSRNKKNITTGKIFYISPVVDEHTMTASVALEIQNDNREWKPGQYVEGYLVLSKDTSEIAVPNSAVITDKSGAKVFVKGEGNEFKAREITIGKTDLYFSSVLSGLKKGEAVLLQPDSITRNQVDSHDHEEGHEE